MAVGVALLVDGVPDPALAQAASLEVHQRLGQPTRFRLVLPVDIAAGDLPLLADARMGPAPACLVRGPVHGQRIRLVHGGAGSRLEVLGGDDSLVMDRESRAALWGNVTDSDAVTAIVGRYGYIPDVSATTPRHLETKHVLVQRESDLAFIHRLARRNGVHFWVSANAAGIRTAHFRRPRLDVAPAAELVINLESPSIELLDLSWDVERPTSASAEQLDLHSKEPLDGTASRSPLAPLGGRGLDTIAPGTRSLHLAVAADDAGDLRARAEAALIEAGYFLRASCSTTTTALGGLVHAAQLVRLRGAGARHSGDWLCTEVKHTVDATAHRMSVALARNGWGG
jgi:phage protein D